MSPAVEERAVDLTIVLPTRNEAGNLSALFDGLAALARESRIAYEVLVVDAGSRDGTAELAASLGARVYQQRGSGYGAALAEAFREVRGDFVVTMDADLSHSPFVIRDLYRRRLDADVLIASRYVRHGFSETERLRSMLSRILNGVFRVALDLPYLDLSSGYRLYRRQALAELGITSGDFDVLIEILVRLHNRGFRIAEVPFHYRPRRYGESNARLLKFALSYWRTLGRMARLRASREAADFEDRGFFSPNPIRRAWHRGKYRWAMQHLEGSARILDLTAGSTRLLEGLPQAVGLDVSLPKLRYRQPLGRRLVQGEPLRLPFADSTFDAVAVFQPDPELERGASLWAEIARVLKPAGKLVYGTLQMADGEARVATAGFAVKARAVLLGRMLLVAGERLEDARPGATAGLA
ncbi:MAG: glycosyltransferase [bacterium]